MIGWDLLEVLHRGVRSSIYRAKRVAGGGASFALKLTSTPKRQQASLMHELQVLETLRGCEGVVSCFGVERDRTQLGLVLEYVPGKSMHALSSLGRMPVDGRLEIMLELLAVLERVHGRGLVHADLSPTNVLLADDGRLHLLDFASAVGLGSDASEGIPRAHERSIAYAAPEQLGRIRRRIDQRSDLYSFGAMLFEVVTGSLPFWAADPLELAHAHVARSPQNPRDLTRECSPALARVILKLLAKDPDARYESSSALRQDLLACRDAAAKRLADFDELVMPAHHNVLRIPDRLYGRAAVLARLEDTIDRAFRGRSAVIALEGPAGIGKTALASALRHCVVQRQGLFIGGKFDVENDRYPLKPLRDAMSQLAAQAPKSSDRALRALTSRLDARLPGAARALQTFAPELVTTLLPGRTEDEVERPGSVDPVPRAAGELLRLISSHGHPICLFIDDLHWATASDLRWLRELIATARLGTLAVILAARIEDSSFEAVYRTLLTELSEQGFLAITQPLEPLTVRDVRPMLQETFDIGASKIDSLLESVFPQSDGNPLFLREILRSIHRDCSVRSDSGGIDLDLARVRALDAGEDVLALLVRHVREQAPATTRVLKYASCLGRDFDHRMLSALVGADALTLLAPAVEAGLVVLAPTAGGSPSCHFAHDRALQAAVSELEEQESLEMHRQIGELMLKERVGSSAPIPFATVAHLNRAARVLAPERLVELAELNAEAARRATQRGHGELALTLARHGIESLGEDAWERHTDLMRKLVLAQAEAAFGWAEHELLTESCALLRAHARTPHERVDALIFEGRFQQSQQRSAQAIGTFLLALQELEVALPEAPLPELVREELSLTEDALREHSPESLANLPACNDLHVARVVELLSKLVFFSYSSSNPLLTVAACRIVRLTVTHGHTADSANGFAFYGLSVVRDRDLDRAMRFARIAMELAEQSGSAAVLSSAHLYSNYLLMHWKVPLRQLSSSFLKAYHYGLQAGSPSNASASATTLCICRFWAGDDLTLLFTELEEYRAQLIRFKQRMVLNWHEILMQLVHNLREPVPSPSVHHAPYYDEALRVPRHIAASETGTLFNFYIAKAMLCLLFDDAVGALAAVDANVPIAPQCASSMWAVPYVYLDSLCRLAACLQTEPSERDVQLEKVDVNIQKLRLWALHNPTEVEHRLRLIEAQRAFAGGRLEHARHLFAEATELTQHVGPHDEALTCELAARFWFGVGESREGRTCLRRAHRAYLLWGATAKARRLEERFAAELAPATWRGPDNDARHASTRELDALDLVGVLSASRAIAGEIRLDALLRRLMGLVIETAGAEAGYLLLPSAEGWMVEAGRNPDGTDVSSPVQIAVLHERSGRILRNDVLDLVSRTGLPSILGAENAALDGPDASHVDAGSVLCFPFVRQGTVEAIAYLENRLAPGVFTQASVAVLEVLSGQVVIALQNARLYQELEDKVQQRTVELRTKNQDLEDAMAKLIELQQQLVMKEKLAALGAITANIAHEIKNPLNFVTNFSELAVGLASDARELAASSDNPALSSLVEQIGQVAEKVAEHGKRAAVIVDSMSLHSARARPVMSPTNLNDLVVQHSQLAAHEGHALRATIRLQLADDLKPVPLLADAMGRVIVNLISNAWHSVQAKYAQVGATYTPEIVVSTFQHRDHVELRVRDNGLGLERDMHEKVFLPFFTSRPDGTGTGLGLSISHDIVVRAHEGTISIESEPGQFAAFTVRLPRERSAGRPQRGAGSRDPLAAL